VRAISGQSRPTLQCPTNPSIDNIIAIRGANTGWQDITLTAPTSAAVTITHLRTTSRVAAEDPTTQDCFPHNCRLIRLTTRAGTPPRVDLTLATPNNASTSTVTVQTEASCPGR
jgi:hypothetical protein